RPFRVPLVPADLDADTTVLGVEVGKSQVARSEVKLLVVERVIRNMHLAVFPEECSVGVKNRTGVVIDAGSAPFEQGNDQRNTGFFGDFGERVGCGAGYGLGQVKQRRIFGAAEILPSE